MKRVISNEKIIVQILYVDVSVTFSEYDKHFNYQHIGSYPDGYNSGSLLKDGGLPTMTARSSAYIGPSP